MTSYRHKSYIAINLLYGSRFFPSDAADLADIL